MTHTVLTCEAKHCDGYVCGVAGRGEITRKLDAKERARPGYDFAWCKECGIKYEVRKFDRAA